ncbi:unnamed protein product [Urochloa humidicola]
MLSPVRRCLEAPASPGRPPTLADDLLEEILLRLTCPADLARASTACATFRRLVADANFLRRYRSLHPPLLLGFIETVSSGFQPVVAPHPNATTARSIARHAAGFSFDYLPSTRWNWNPWDACDVRDGRVLLKSSYMGITGIHFPDLAVCDPLFRRYRLLPPIPEDLLASVHLQPQIVPSFEAFLVPSGEAEEDGTSFRVIGRAHRSIRSVVFVFSFRLWPMECWCHVGQSYFRRISTSLSLLCVWQHLLEGDGDKQVAQARHQQDGFLHR